MKKILAILLFLVVTGALAQTKPAYSVAEISFINQDAYQNDLWPKIQKLVNDAGGQVIVASAKSDRIVGASQVADKVTIIKFKSYQQAKDFYASKSYQALKPLAEKSVKIKLYIVEGE